MLRSPAALARWLEDGANRAVVGDWHAIVVLGGHPSLRCAEAARLWHAGRAPVVVLVGGRPVDGTPGEVRKSRVALRAEGVPAAATVEISKTAPGTWEEAGEVAALTIARGWSRVIVVTSPYHCRRAGQMLRRRMPSGCVLRVVSAHEERWPEWWTRPRLVRLVVRELLKLGMWRTGLRERWTRA